MTNTNQYNTAYVLSISFRITTNGDPKVFVKALEPKIACLLSVCEAQAG